MHGPTGGIVELQSSLGKTSKKYLLSLATLNSPQCQSLVASTVAEIQDEYERSFKYNCASVDICVGISSSGLMFTSDARVVS